MKFLFPLGLCCLAVPSFAHGVSAPQADSQKIINCGQLLDIKAGVWREKVSITIENGNVVSIGAYSQDAKALDLKSYSCLPGLIDMHVHLTGETQAQVDQFRDTLTADTADQAYRSVELAKKTLYAGFTSVRDLGSEAGLNVALKRAINSKSHYRSKNVYFRKNP